MVGKPLNI